ncbi:hypothetical protein PHLCEN_2v13600 [Hermanssonia centrifuga]|uniref:Uncharacterized protein n=1 Tax=Hermanssonia centrifuga TaxID=98765 RepID=A0A2R6NE00_9APHY|nr:hypothetical protein PHLCEN_2v13600 [Hermanssonia centrifuga]
MQTPAGKQSNAAKKLSFHRKIARCTYRCSLDETILANAGTDQNARLAILIEEEKNDDE